MAYSEGMAQEQETEAKSPRVHTETMLSTLREYKPDASRGTLETLCDQGLLPQRARTGQEGRRPIWTYPFGAERQLRALMVWREVAHDPDQLRVALWVDGYPVDLHRVQRSIRDALAKMVAGVNRAAEAAAPANATEAERRRALAARAAGLRGSNALVPRKRGVSAAERTNAVEALFNTFMFGQAGEVSDDTAEQVLQLIGLNGAPGPTTPASQWLTGSPAAISDIAPHVGLQQFLEVAETATDTELDLVRPLLQSLLVGLPIIAKLMSTVHGADAAGFGALTDLGRQPELPVLLVPLLIGLHRAGQTQGLMEVVAALGPIPAQAAELLAIQELPQKELEANLQNQPPKVADAVRLLLQNAPLDDIEATLERQAKDSIGRRGSEKRKS